MTGMTRKDDLLFAAAELFADYGYHNVTMKQIAKAVGIQSASIYNHYQSKDEILGAIFDYYRENRIESLPPIQELVALVGTEPPHATLMRTIAVYPAETLPMMSMALRIADALGVADERANAIIDDVINLAGDYMRPLLRRMIELNLIEPIDVEHFALTVTSFCHSAAVRYYEGRCLSDKEYMACMTLLFQLVKVRTPDLPPED